MSSLPFHENTVHSSAGILNSVMSVDIDNKSIIVTVFPFFLHWVQIHSLLGSPCHMALGCHELHWHEPPSVGLHIPHLSHFIFPVSLCIASCLGSSWRVLIGHVAVPRKLAMGDYWHSQYRHTWVSVADAVWEASSLAVPSPQKGSCLWLGLCSIQKTILGPAGGARTSTGKDSMKAPTPHLSTSSRPCVSFRLWTPKLWGLN